MTDEQRVAKVEALNAQLVAAVDELTEGEQWTSMLRAAGRFHSYSFRNMMLIWLQAEQRGMAPTAVAGFTTWKSLGRSVRKGERGLAILAPVTRRVASDDEPAVVGESEGGRRVMRGVKIAHVFDISQTDGPPLPVPPRPVALAGEDEAGLWQPLADLVEAEGYVLRRDPEDGSTQGWTDHANRVVSVRPDIDGAFAAAVLAHELGHIRADHGGRIISRAQKETEAESIAYVVMAAHGCDSAISAVPYVAGWSNSDHEVIAAAAETVHTVAAGILADLGLGRSTPTDVEGSPAAEFTTRTSTTTTRGRAASRGPGRGAGPVSSL
jgi:antirestriction protein ArdC